MFYGATCYALAIRLSMSFAGFEGDRQQRATVIAIHCAGAAAATQGALHGPCYSATHDQNTGSSTIVALATLLVGTLHCRVLSLLYTDSAQCHGAVFWL
jgi:hypothetical protein